ncbi:MAG: dihydrolipoamide acetyltransferase family protein [Xanthomonadales bacterium]
MANGIYPVTVPKWGIEMQEGTIVGWHAEEGGEIARGDELVDIETDKIINTMEAPTSGVLRRRLVSEGETLQVGALLGVIAPADIDDHAIDEFMAGFKPSGAASGHDDRSTAAKRARVKSAPQQPEPAVESEESAPKRVRISPAAARRAKELGVDIKRVKSAGRRRISPEDVERYAREHKDSTSADSESSEYEARPMSATRKSIARRLVEAKQQIPHFYLSIDINMDAALDRREEINTQAAQKVSVNDVVMRAVVLALQSVPDVNIHVVRDEIRWYRHINLAIAVATERGIITPVIHKAETLTIVELAKEAAALGECARSSSLTREEVAGGTFTVSNLGMYGVVKFQAIINPPQGAILALGACEERIVPGADAIEKVKVMHTTLSCDHRAIDGALGAQFLAKLKDFLESPTDL